MNTRPRILVIKLSAFGDFCLSLGLFERIRAHHADAHITLMTTHPFRQLGQDCGAFDEVRTIARWHVGALGPWLRYLKSVWRQPYDMVYDLQANDRTRALRLLSPPVMRRGWLSARQPSPVPGMLDITPHLGSLPQNMTWLTATAQDFDTPRPYVLLVPGSAPQHPAKRWPAPHYADLAQALLAQGITPVLLGTAAEAETTALIAASDSRIVDLTGQTSMADMAALATKAAAAVGNDTGPMHLISICRCPVVSLFSSASNPVQSAPRGPVVRVLQEQDLAHLPASAVLAELLPILR